MTEPMVDEKWSYNIDTIYEFTINLNDDYQVQTRKGCSDLRDVHATKIMREVLESFGPNFKYNLRFEISMPQFGDRHTNSMGRIHWHGIVKFTTTEAIYDFLLTGIHKLTRLGRFQFNEYRPEVWPKYCTKHEHIFKKKNTVRNISWQHLIQDQAKLIA